MGNINRQRGKRSQKKIAEKVNGIDIGVLGKIDVLTEKFIIEVKDRAKFIGENWLEQVEKHKDRKEFKGKKCLVIVHKRGRRYENSVVMMRLKDFLELVNGIISGVSQIPNKQA